MTFSYCTILGHFHSGNSGGEKIFCKSIHYYYIKGNYHWHPWGFLKLRFLYCRSRKSHTIIQKYRQPHLWNHCVNVRNGLPWISSNLSGDDKHKMGKIQSSFSLIKEEYDWIKSLIWELLGTNQRIKHPGTWMLLSEITF